MTGANPSREAASRASAAVRARQQQQMEQAQSAKEEEQRKKAAFHQELTETCVDILARLNGTFFFPDQLYLTPLSS